MNRLYVCDTKDGDFDNSPMVAIATSKEQAYSKFKKQWLGAKMEDIYEIKLEDGAGYFSREDNER